jgi:hypothetical protein
MLTTEVLSAFINPPGAEEYSLSVGAHGVTGDSFWCNISLYATHEDRKKVVSLRVKRGVVLIQLDRDVG